MAKALDSSQIQTLLRHDKQQTRNSPEWPNSGDRKLIHDATKDHKKTVVLSDGREYNLTYETRDSLAWESYEAVFVKPVSDNVPCGWFRLKSLLAGN